MALSLHATPTPSGRRQWHPPPVYHLRAPQGWMNDPCAPAFDTSTQTYHLFYQWNPSSCDWGNITWGQYTSRDGLQWAHNGVKPVLKPSTPYDKDGIFTGCMYPTGPRGEAGQLSVFYTSVTSLPIHWTLPYTRDCEGLSLATSTDGGHSWQKSPLNPILRGEPEDLIVTGFRDPYVAKWPAMDRIRGKTSLYAMLSGGILNKGPATFLYAVQPEDLSKWEYIGTVGDVDAGFRPCPQWAGDFGVNWECVNFMTLKDTRKEFEFLTMCSEGGQSWGSSPVDESRQQTLWMAGTLTGTAEKPELAYNFGGILDHGCLYAMATYEHPVTSQRVAWGWLREDELSLERRTAKGWAGHLSLPRELFLYHKSGVVSGLNSSLDEMHHLIHETDADKTKTVWTLGIRPMANLVGLRRKKLGAWSGINGARRQGQLGRVNTHWEMEARINISARSGRVGFVVAQSEDGVFGTRVVYDMGQQAITVDRTHSNHEADIAKDPVSGPFTLFVSEHGGEEQVEQLHLRVFRDGDVLEVFANDRFSLSTMVYSDASCKGVAWFAEAEGTVLEQVDIWDLSTVFEESQPRARV